MQVSTILTALSMTLAGTALAQEPVWDANKVILESQELADGVFAVIPENAEKMAAQGLPIATTSGFIIGSDGVLVIDSMLNERLNTQLIKLIANETDLPVRYMVNTSSHGDHSYGNHYLPDEVTIIQHVATQEYINAHFVEDVAFMTQNFGEGRGIEDIEATDANLLVGDGSSLVVDLGGITVEVGDYGFAQTGGDLFVSVPSVNVVWTGNPVVSTAPALPWLLDGHLLETRDTLQAVYDAFDSDTRVVPGHGPVTNVDTIQWNIDYLSAVETEVRSAIAEGLSLEDTVARVQMPKYKGYALFSWVHPGLNIPAAYKDLK